MRQLLLIFGLLMGFTTLGQIKGTVRDEQGNPISFATVVLENTQNGTISNENGQYELTIRNNGTYTVLYQFLGYKTVRSQIVYQGDVITKDIVLAEEEFMLEDIVILVGDNPADEIIRRAIKNKEINTKGLSEFEVDFYSKGMVKSLKVPKALMNKIKVNDADLKDTGVDSLGKGIMYLSETVSELKFKKPNKLKEHIVASKVSGSDNGYSFNTADESFYDFYENHIDIADIGTKLISPIANQAFSYYKFNLEATFKDEGRVINKIKVIPKVKMQPVFYGDLYIVDDSGAIYGMDLAVSGISIQEPIIEEIAINQNFFYEKEIQTWVKRSQNIDMTFGIFGIRVQGIFLSVFNNYDFTPQFTNQTFGKEILSYSKDVHKKEDDFWESNRMFALTEEEVLDYQFKDSIKEIKQSPQYLDSIRRKNNAFKLDDPLFGYRYTAPDRKATFTFDGLIDVEKIGFNTVQGLSLGTGVGANFRNKEKGSYTSLKADVNYGVSSERFRAYGYASHRFGDVHKSSIYLKGGTQIKQFHESNINEYINAAFSLLARKNFAKYYNNEEVYVGYIGRFLEETIQISTALGYEQRKPLFNNTNASLYSGSRAYTSNNPLALNDYESAAIDNHHLYKFKLGASFSFGQKYISYPEGKTYISNPSYPKVHIYYEKGFGGSESNLNYDLISAQINQSVEVSNKGELSYSLGMGHYFDESDISFVDRKHFSGNETHLTIGDTFLKSFNLLPYYALSTNKSYIETHLEYDFKGFLINKIPLLNKTGWNTVLGYHNVTVSDYKPYMEFTAGFSNVGFGKFRFFRVDYVRSYSGSAFQKDGIMIGFKKNM